MITTTTAASGLGGGGDGPIDNEAAAAEAAAAWEAEAARLVEVAADEGPSGEGRGAVVMGDDGA